MYVKEITKKDDKMREVSLEVLQNLASENNINVLFKELSINEKNKIEVCQILVEVVDIIMNKLLNSLRYTSDSKERISIIHIIEEGGEGQCRQSKKCLLLILHGTSSDKCFCVHPFLSSDLCRPPGTHIHLRIPANTIRAMALMAKREPMKSFCARGCQSCT